MRLRHRLNVPAREFAGRRQTSVSAVEPPEGSALCAPAQKTGALHPRARREIILVRTDGTFGTTGTCGTRMRRNQKDFFHPSPSVLPCKNARVVGQVGQVGAGELRAIKLPAEDCRLKTLYRTDGTFGTSGTCGTRMRRDRKFFFSVPIRPHLYPSVLFRRSRSSVPPVIKPAED